MNPPLPLSHPGVAEVADFVQPHPDFCMGDELMVCPHVLTLLQQVPLLTKSPSQPYITLKKKKEQKQKPSSMGFGDLAEVPVLAGKALK